MSLVDASIKATIDVKEGIDSMDSSSSSDTEDSDDSKKNNKLDYIENIGNVLRNFIIKKNELTLKELIGEGAYGQVY